MRADNLPWIEVQMNHVHNDNCKKRLNNFTVKHPNYTIP